tara:strand:+ start:945 stop:1418 length:474 start_codon:yes stop_codon:yes gene_type:complete
MAVPSSGALSLLGIKRELSDDNYSSSNSHSNISLKDCSDGTVENINLNNASSDRPDGNAPHSMSEFYAYDHDFVSVTSFTGGISGDTANAACSIEDFEDTVYHNGSGDFPGMNDIVYSDAGTTTLNSSHIAFFNASEAKVFVTTSSSGVVNAAGDCR